MSNQSSATSERPADSVTLRAYVTGYLASLLLTFAAYMLVRHHTFGRDAVIGTIAALALAQFAVQLRYFLHLGYEMCPRWKVLVFWLMIMVVAILVFGSLWIMNNLNRHMTPQQINTYLQSQDGL